MLYFLNHHTGFIAKFTDLSLCLWTDVLSANILLPISTPRVSSSLALIKSDLVFLDAFRIAVWNFLNHLKIITSGNDYGHCTARLLLLKHFNGKVMETLELCAIPSDSV